MSHTALYQVIQDHTSEYPNPITLTRGDILHVGQAYTGPENWENWYLCTAPGQAEGWVPGQILQPLDAQMSRVTEDYTARELNVRKGEQVSGERLLNGWAWCIRHSDQASGWIPLANLRLLEQDGQDGTPTLLPAP